MEILVKIKKSIDWYNQNYKVATINQLIDLKTKLVTENFYLAELVSENNCFCLQWENEKKVKYAKEKQRLLSDSYQIGKAEAKAESEIENERTQHTEYKIVFDRLKMLHNQTNEVCNDIMQRIAILRKEIEYTAKL